MENSSLIKEDDPFINKVFFTKYTVVKKLGEGSFGLIYMAQHGEEQYALKFEHKRKGQSLLEAEAYVMSYLKGRKSLK
jgi:predicted Ser/Thr protein kinase